MRMQSFLVVSALCGGIWLSSGQRALAAQDITTGGAAAPAQPTELAVFHRSGQTFITWTERADLDGEAYRVYRSAQPITSASLVSATLLYTVSEGSDRFFADRYNVGSSGVWAARYVDRFVIQDDGPQLPAGTGLLVWTLETQDFGGAASGAGYYAVTTVDAQGNENRLDFGPANATPASLNEAVADPLPVQIATGDGGLGHVFIQYMNLREWNPTFHAPRQGNGYYGLSPDSRAVTESVQYAYTYAVGEPPPANCDGSVPAGRLPLILYLHGWGGNSYPPDSGAAEWYCTFQIRPTDISETWYFGFARRHDFRQGGDIEAGDTIANYTEQRLLRMLYDLLRHPAMGARIDHNRIYVYGSSMGGSGTLAMALRYPNLFAAAYISQGMTNYRTSGDGGGTDWRGDITPKWGDVSLNLPVQIRGPGNWADALRRYDGTGVWDWQNHQANLQTRVADDMVPFGIGHGTSDMTIEWPTQGQPVYAALNASRQAWGGFVNQSDHTWMGYAGLPPTLRPSPDLVPFFRARVALTESVPGLSNASGNSALPPVTTTVSNYNQALEWSASWDAWDGAPVDTPGEWRISLRTTDEANQTVDVTPRRLQSFRVTPSTPYAWENRRASDNSLVASGTSVAGANGILTIAAFAVSPDGNRLVVRPGAPVSYTLTVLTAGSGSGTVAPPSGRSYPAGTAVILTATPGAGSIFIGWSGALFGAANPVTLTMDANKMVTATFALRLSPRAFLPLISPDLDGPGRSFPSTADRIVVYNDQLYLWGATDALIQFAATHYAGSQKQTLGETRQLRAYNPDYLVLHYRLGQALGHSVPGAGCQPTTNYLYIVVGTQWVREWPGNSVVQEPWFYRRDGSRVFNCTEGHYLMDLDNAAWRAWWSTQVISQLIANENDGVFADSYNVPSYGFVWNPQLPDIDAAFEAEWAAREHAYTDYIRSRLAGRWKWVPNVGAFVTTRDPSDYSNTDGLMIEGFAEWSNGSYFDMSDWQLQMNRLLPLSAAGKIIIAQTYVGLPYASPDDVEERLFVLGSYLLIKGSHTYINMDTGLAPEWFPEYSVDLGAPIDALPGGIDDLLHPAWGAYVRRYSRGMVLVNPTGSAVTAALGGTYYRVVPSGGGEVPPSGVAPGSLSYTPVTSVVLGAHQAAIVLNAVPSQPGASACPAAAKCPAGYSQ